MENNSISPNSAAWPTRWPKDSFAAGPTAVLVLVAIGIALLVMLAAVAFLHNTIVTTRTVPLVPAVVVQLILEAFVVAALLIGLPFVARCSLRDLGFRAMTGRDLGIALLGAIAMILVVEGGASLVETLLHTKHEQNVIEMFKAIHDPHVLWFFAIFAIALAPIAEETVFRIFFFNIGLRYGGFWIGATISGILFGLAHMDAFVFVPLALGGVILCGVYYLSRNAYASMITHACFNATTVAALLFAPHLAK